MATEQIWGATPTETTNGGDYSPDSSEVSYPYEAITTVYGAAVLYKIKKTLIDAGWTVVSSSARVSYPTEQENPNAGYSFFNGQHVSGTMTVPAAIDTAKFYYDGPTIANESTLPDALTTSGEGWIYKSFSFLDTNSIFEASSGDLWTSVDEGLEYKKIYPGLVRDHWTGSLAQGSSTDRYKSVHSRAYRIFGETDVDRFIYYVPGRAWCLLRAPDAFAEAGSSGKNYHILLDFAASYDDGDRNPNLADAASNTAGVWSDQTFVGNEYLNNFGNKIAIYVFPDYSPGDSRTNPAGDPTPWRRPTHENEFGYPNKSVTFSGETANNAAEMFWITPIGTSAVGTYNVNCLFAKESESATTGNGNFHIFVSQNGVPISLFTANNIADVLNKDGTKVGTKYFLFWSYKGRGDLTPIGVGSAAFTNYTKAPTTTTWNNNISDRMKTLNNTIFDSREAYTHLFYYRKYDPSTGEYDAKRLVTCVPTFWIAAGNNYDGRAIPAQLFRDGPIAKTTIDYTYVEWPLPLIDLNSSRNNYRYIGRMSDVKLGPALAQTGLLAKQEGSENYDRLLFGGLWFGCDLTDALII